MLLFKAYGDIDAIPLCIRSKDPDEIVRTVSLLLGSFGGVNLEDIAAPRCFEIERKLKEISVSRSSTTTNTAPPSSPLPPSSIPCA